MRHLDRTKLRYPGLWRGCVGAWAPLLGPSGSVLRDMSGNRINGTFSGGMPASSGWSIINGYSTLYLDGSGDYISVPNSDATNVTTESFAICAWFQGTGNLTKFIVNKTNGAGTKGYEIYSGGANGVQYRLNSGTEYNISYVPSAQDGKWHCAILQRTQNAMQAWFDGGLVNETANTSPASLTNSNDLQFGARLGSNNYTGGIAEVRLYKNRGLSESEIKLLSLHPGIAYETTRNRSYKAAALGGFPMLAGTHGSLVGGSLVGGRLVR